MEEQRVSWNIHSDIHNLHVPLAAIDPIDALFCFSKLLAGLKNDGVWFWLQSLTFTLLIWICSWKSRYRFSHTLNLWQNQYCMYFSIEIHTGGFSWTLKGFSNTLFFFLSFFWYKEGFTAFNFIDNKMLNSARVIYDNAGHSENFIWLQKKVSVFLGYIIHVLSLTSLLIHFLVRWHIFDFGTVIACSKVIPKINDA